MVKRGGTQADSRGEQSSHLPAFPEPVAAQLVLLCEALLRRTRVPDDAPPGIRFHTRSVS